MSALVVTVAAPARALSACTDPTFCPVANEDDYQINFGAKLTVDAAHGLLANDEGPPLTHVSTLVGDTDTESLNFATVSVKSDGSFTYTPDPSNPFSGLDSFDYLIYDSPGSNGDFDFNTVYINVVPVVRDDVYTVHSDQVLTVNEPGVLANDGGIDPDSLVLDGSSLQGGTVEDSLGGAFVYTPPAGFSGTDSFTYTGNDLDFDPDPYTGTVTIKVDGTPPAVTMSAPAAAVTLSTKVGAAWSATDTGGSGVANYDVQDAIAPWNAGFAAWTAFRSATSAASGTLSGTYGRTFCFRTRARDRVGNVSAFTASYCTSVPLRARSLAYSKLWSRKANAVYFSGEAVVTTSKGQNANRTGVSGKRMWLVATKCATCGAVQVRFNNVVIANVNLASAVTVRHALIPIAAFPAVRAGTLALFVTSPTGKSVIIEGLAVLRA
jgi:hypothetical protein